MRSMVGGAAAMTEPRKFSFDTVFEGDGDVVQAPQRRKAFYTAAEIEQARQEAYAQGERAALDAAQRQEAAALDEIRRAVGQAMGSLARAAQEHRAGAAELALACARKIADAALDRFPEAPAKAALEALLQEVEGHPRLFVRAAEAVQAPMQAALDEVAQATGFAGQVTVKPDPGLSGAAFVFEWGEGRAAFAPEEAARRVADALEAALAAEGLHADPLTPARGSSDV